MSDNPAARGWYQATDGKWYPPGQASATTPPAPAPTARPDLSDPDLDFISKQLTTLNGNMARVASFVGWLLFLQLLGIVLALLVGMGVIADEGRL